MSKYCADCKYLQENKKKEGNISGSIYYCNKTNQFINSTTTECKNFEKDYSRKWYKAHELYDEGKKFKDSNLSYFWFLLIITLIIFGIIIEIFNI